MNIVPRKSRTSPADWRRLEGQYRRIAARKTPKPAEVTVSPDLRAAWSGRRADGVLVAVCSRHLLQLALGDIKPMSRGLCAVCSAPAVLTTHSVERWIERCAPTASADQARLDLHRFLGSGQVTPTPPVSVGDGAQAVINLKWPGVVCIVKAADSGPSCVLTVLLERGV